MKLIPNEIFIDELSNRTYFNDNGKLRLIATIGAPAGSPIELDGITVEELVTTKADFYADNNLITTPITDALTSVVFSTPTDVGDGTVDFRASWKWEHVDVNGKIVQPIDGFFIQVVGSTADVAADFTLNSKTSGDIIKFLPAVGGDHKTFHYTFNGVMNSFYTMRITPYRTVKALLASEATVIYGPPTTSSRTQSYALKFNNIDVSALSISYNNVIEDGVIEPYEKKFFVLPYLAKIATTPDSEYSNVLAKLAGLTGIPASLTSNITTARNALNQLLTQTYHEAKPDNTASTVMSDLLTGANRKKTHLISDKALFLAVFDTYEKSLISIDFAITLFLLNANDQAQGLISTIADLIMDVGELVSLDARFQAVTDSYNNHLMAAAVTKASITPVTTAFNNLKTGLTTPRFTLSALNVTSSSADTPFLPKLNGGASSSLRRIFVDRVDVITFYNLWDAWYAASDAFDVVTKAASESTLTSISSFDHSTDYRINLLSQLDKKWGLILTNSFQSTLLNWLDDTWEKKNNKLMVNNNVTNTLTTLRAQLLTLLNANQDTFNTKTYVFAQDVTTIKTFKGNNAYIILKSITSLESLFNKAVEMYVAKQALAISLGLSLSQIYSDSKTLALFLAANTLLVFVKGDQYVDKLTGLRSHYDGTTWVVDSISVDSNIPDGGADFATLSDLLAKTASFGNDSVISIAEKTSGSGSLQSLLDTARLESEKFTADIAKYNITTTYASKFAALETMLTVTRHEMLKPNLKSYSPNWYRRMFGTGTSVYFANGSSGGYVGGSDTKCNNKVDPIAFNLVIADYLAVRVALKSAITEAAKLVIEPTATVVTTDPETQLPVTVTIVDYMKGVDTILDDDVIVSKEKTGLKAILDDAKAEHADVLERYRFYGVPDAGYTSTYNALVTALEVTRYQICDMPGKKLVVNRFSRLLGIEKEEYTSTGVINNTGGRAYKTCYQKSHLITDIAAFRVVIANYQLRRNTAAKLHERGKWVGSATTAGAIAVDKPKVPGSFYWNPDVGQKRLYGVRSSFWVLVVILASANEGYGNLDAGQTPDKGTGANSTIIRFYDTQNGLYYTRRKTTDSWSLVDITKPITIYGTTLPGTN
jgi:hypothetical protein